MPPSANVHTPQWMPGDKKKIYKFGSSKVDFDPWLLTWQSLYFTNLCLFFQMRSLILMVLCAGLCYASSGSSQVNVETLMHNGW